MSAQLGPPLIQLFAPRPPLRYLVPHDDPPEKRTTTSITGVAGFLSFLERQDTDYQGTETVEETKQRERAEKRRKYEDAQREALAKFNPNEDTEVQGDPYKTLFVSRLSYEVTEDDLQREFGRYGAIERIRLVACRETQKPRGYAFLVFERERDMRAAYKDTDGIKIKGRRICVDVERGRTVKNWKPMRLGGGLGGRRKPGRPDPLGGRPSGYSSSSRPMDNRPFQNHGHSGNQYNSRDDRPRDRSAQRHDRRNDSYRGNERSSDRNDRGYGAAPTHSYSTKPPPSTDRARQGRQGIGFDQAPDHRANGSRPYQDSHIDFAPSSHQTSLDPRARQPPTTYTSTVPTAPSAPWLADGQSSSDTRRQRPTYDDARDRDIKRRRY